MPLLPPAVIVMSMDPVPATVGEVDSSSRLELLLAKCTFNPAGAGAPSVKNPWICRNLPMETFCVMPMPEVETLAATEPTAAGTENPVGTSTESVLLPADTREQPLVAPADPAGIVTGETVIVPTPVFELVMLTLTGGNPVEGPTGGSQPERG